MIRGMLMSGLVILTHCLACTGCGFMSGDKNAEPAQTVDDNAAPSLQALIDEVGSKFEPAQFAGTKGRNLDYWLYKPTAIQPDSKYPLVLYAGETDASAPESYGALIWADQKLQASNPCYVLVPRLAQAASGKSAMTQISALVRSLAQNDQIDLSRVYLAGQSAAMNLALNNPETFAAALFVDGTLTSGNLNKLIRQNFTLVGSDATSGLAQTMQKIETAARKGNRSFTTASWESNLPLNTQDELASTMLAKAAPINLFTVESKAVEGASEKPVSLGELAYQLAPVRDWLFKYSK